MSLSVYLGAGPASAIHAARRGWRRSHAGSYGALAPPIIDLLMMSERVGITTMPQGSRWMCGVGLSDTCPPANALSSPPILAASPVAASWQLAERTKPDSQA